MSLEVLILGAGIAGLTSALAISKNLPNPAPKVTIYEVRPTPSTIGGAVGLTPKALRYLDYLGVLDILKSEKIGAECRVIEIIDLYSGRKYAEVSYHDGQGEGIGKEGSKYFARRVERFQLQQALLQACGEIGNIQVVFGKKVTHIEESTGDGVQLAFDDGQPVVGDLLVGCDGIHSAVRSLLVDSQRSPRYTGVSTVMTRTKLEPGRRLKWETTGLTTSRRGSVMCSYYDETRCSQYMAAVIETVDVQSREGWRVRGSDQKAMKDDIMTRFKHDSMPELADMIEDAGDWSLYPVYALPPNGRWISPRGRCILLGDAAHAVSLFCEEICPSY